MKLLIVLSLTLATASTFDLRGAKTESDNAIASAGKNKSDITSRNQFPYHVNLLMYLENSEKRYCGGCLIGHKWVLTAGYCTQHATYAIVYLGVTNSSEAKVVYHVPQDRISTHYGYNGSPLYNIGLIGIPWVEFNSNIQPIKLPALTGPYSTYSGEYAIVSHLEGKYGREKFVTKAMNSNRLQIISNDVCESTYKFPASSSLCGSIDGVASTCLSSYGDPLSLESTGVLIGLTSFVPHGDCPMTSPGAFSRVNSYLYWIFLRTGIFS